MPLYQSFQYAMPAKRPTVAMIGLPMGRTMLTNVRISDAPSICADSISALGMLFWKNVRMIRTKYTFIRSDGTSRPASVFFMHKYRV